MILSSTPCNPTKLPKLLQGELTVEESNRLEEHLSYCGKCQRQLEQLAGSRQWWESTETALRVRMNEAKETASHLSLNPKSSGSHSAEESLDHAHPWLAKLAPNGMLGPFRLEKTIGFGGTGVVAQAFDTQLNRRVAVKVLYPHLAASGAAKQRFAREAQAAAAVVHPSVVPIHAVDADHSPPYLVMTYVPGGSLQQRLDRDGPLELVEILRIALQISDGLAAAHAQGLVHRDVKPANILLEAGTDRVLLTDFGLARALDDATLTASGFVAGTPPYMSPEQARGDSVDGRSDIFSVGSLLFAMATGRAPFVGSSALNILQQVNEKGTPSVREINERLPEWLDQLIARCHAKNPSSRIQSARELGDLLRQCLAYVQKPNAFAIPKELARGKGFRWATVASALLVGSLIGIGVGWIATPPERKGDRSNQQRVLESNPQTDAQKNVTGNVTTPAGTSLGSTRTGNPFATEDDFLFDLAQIQQRLKQLKSQLEGW